MTLKRISEEEIVTGLRIACNTCSEQPCRFFSCMPSDRAVAQAQLEADQKEYKILQDKIKGLEELMGGQKEAHNAVIRGIKEGLEKYHSGLAPQFFSKSEYPDIEKVDIQMTISRWQEVWQKYLGGK